jgi:hypothetical protein
VKSTTPKSVRLDDATDKRLADLLRRVEPIGIKFPLVVNIALSHLLDELDAGATLDLHGPTGPRIVRQRGREAVDIIESLDEDTRRALLQELERRTRTGNGKKR